MNKDTEKTRSVSIDRWIPNRLGDQVNQVHVHLTGMFFPQISPNTKLNFHLCVFRAVSHWTSSPPWLCSNWYLGEGRLGNHFQTKTKQGSFGYQVYSTASQRNTNQWLFCTWWPSLLNYLLFVDFLLSFTHRNSPRRSWRWTAEQADSPWSDWCRSFSHSLISLTMYQPYL